MGELLWESPTLVLPRLISCHLYPQKSILAEAQHHPNLLGAPGENKLSVCLTFWVQLSVCSRPLQMLFSCQLSHTSKIKIVLQNILRYYQVGCSEYLVLHTLEMEVLTSDLSSYWKAMMRKQRQGVCSSALFPQAVPKWAMESYNGHGFLWGWAGGFTRKCSSCCRERPVWKLHLSQEQRPRKESQAGLQWLYNVIRNIIFTALPLWRYPMTQVGCNHVYNPVRK